MIQTASYMNIRKWFTRHLLEKNVNEGHSSPNNGLKAASEWVVMTHTVLMVDVMAMFSGPYTVGRTHIWSKIGSSTVGWRSVVFAINSGRCFPTFLAKLWLAILSAFESRNK